MRRVVAGLLLLLAIICVGEVAPAAASPAPSLFPARDGGKWGFINKKGQVVIPARFAGAGVFVDGLALATTHSQKFGFIDTGGKMAIPEKFEDGFEFSEGLALVKLNGKWGFIDRTGRAVVEPQYSQAGSFNEGLAAVVKDGQSSFIDKKGSVVLGPFPSAYSFSEGFAGVKSGEAWGFCDRQGKIVIPHRFDEVGGFHEGLAPVRLKGKWGFIDRSGKTVIEPTFASVGYFSGGLARIKVDGRWGYIDPGGRPVIAPQFEEAGGMSEGLGAVKRAGRCGYVTRDGKVVIAPQYDRAWAFEGGLAMVTSGEKMIYIDKTGQKVWEGRPSPAAMKSSNMLALFDAGSALQFGLSMLDVSARNPKALPILDEELRWLDRMTDVKDFAAIAVALGQKPVDFKAQRQRYLSGWEKVSDRLSKRYGETGMWFLRLGAMTRNATDLTQSGRVNEAVDVINAIIQHGKTPPQGTPKMVVKALETLGSLDVMVQDDPAVLNALFLINYAFYHQ